MSQEITEAPVRKPFVNNDNKESGLPGRAWQMWLSELGDALAGMWGAESRTLTLPVGYGGTLASQSIVHVGRMVYVNLRITGTSVAVPATISGLPSAYEKAILDTVLLDGSGSLLSRGVAVVSAGVATLSAPGTASEILITGFYRTR